MLQEYLTQIYDEVSPSVVNIQMTIDSSRAQSPEMAVDSGHALLPGQTAQQARTGVGLCVDTDGHIVTNNHVVDGGSEGPLSPSTTVRPCPPEVVGPIPNSDLAVIKGRPTGRSAAPVLGGRFDRGSGLVSSP